MLPNRQLNLLKNTLPNEATLRSRVNQILLVDVHVLRPTGGIWKTVPIEISLSTESKLQAREYPANWWPTFCPQRHINEGGYFCLGLSDIPSVNDLESARHWWAILTDHLQLQCAADETRKWPGHRELDHGEAGEIQEKMEKLAKDNDLLDVVRSAHNRKDGWLANNLPKLTKKGDRLVNGRAPCPHGCKKHNRPILRRKCCKQEIIFRLVELEYKKREQSKKFWNHHTDKACCGRMKNCQLRKEL